MPSIHNASTDNQPPSDRPSGFNPQPNRDQIRDWVRRSQPNARLVYGHGPMAQNAAPTTCELVMELYRGGWLTPHFIRGRDGTPDRHIVQRTQRPFLRGMKL